MKSLFGSIALSYLAQAALVVYPAPQGAPLTRDFSVEVRRPGGAWQGLPVYYAYVSHRLKALNGFVSFDFDGKVEIRVTRNVGEVESWEVRPRTYRIPTVEDVLHNRVEFTLDRPRKLSVEFNHDLNRNLFIFANALEKDVPKPGDPNVVYFGPGMHEIGVRWLKSNQTVYVAGGALVIGKFEGLNVDNVTIRGRGILDAGAELKPGTVPRGNEVGLRGARNARVEGIIIRGDDHDWTMQTTHVNGMVIEDVKLFSEYVSDDGIDPVNSANITIRDVFMRTADDNVAVKGFPVADHWIEGIDPSYLVRDMKNILVEDSVLWCDQSQAVVIGAETSGGDIHDVTARNLIVLESRDFYTSPSTDYGPAVLGIYHGGNGTVSNVLFENIMIEEAHGWELGSKRIFDCVLRKWSNYKAGWPDFQEYGNIRNVTLRNVTSQPDVPVWVKIGGYDESHTVEGITFENLSVAGRMIGEADRTASMPSTVRGQTFPRCVIGPFAKDVKFVVH